LGAIIGAIWANIGIVHIVLFTLGIIFMVTEFFEPGIGIFGIVGIVLMVIDIFILAENFVQGLILFAALAIIVLLFVLMLLLFASKGILPKKLVLSESTDNESGYVASAKVELNEGDEGVTVTYLRPAGKAAFGDTKYDVVSEGEFVESGVSVKVLSVVGSKITVKPIEKE